MPSFEIRKRRGKMVALVSDGEELMRIDTQVAIDEGLRENVDYDNEELARIKALSDSMRAKRRAYYMLAGRDYSTAELKRKLTRKDGEQAAQEAIEKMEQLRLLDDEEYARSEAARLHEYKHFAPMRIVMELKQKGIDPLLAQTAVDELEIDEEDEVASLLRGKLGAKLGDEKENRRVFNALVRYGYRPGTVRSAMREYIRNDD